MISLPSPFAICKSKSEIPSPLRDSRLQVFDTSEQSTGNAICSVNLGSKSGLSIGGYRLPAWSNVFFTDVRSTCGKLFKTFRSLHPQVLIKVYLMKPAAVSSTPSPALLPSFHTRLWQDAENRTLLANLLIKNSSQRPKILTVEDKLMVLGCNRASEDRTIPLSVIAERTKLTVEDHELPERQKAFWAVYGFIWSSMNNYWVVRVRLCHFSFGRTPSCSEALIRAKVKKVVVGMVDPNPIVSSRGTWLHSGQRVVVQEKSKEQDLPTKNVVTVQVSEPTNVSENF
ncbi:hypothetical protein L2E82_06520 [Cichorium intybus]|uniref:Uncharacterized protein n=1 Tax=Cichorium intybus TaxID=13427 RepID=A0ACB9HBD5_CICIN|nr:hypothetical protein L2E82_06520 [Cichorium intybus]